MEQGKLRFEYQLNKVAQLTAQANTQADAGMWLLANDLRTPMFMLESLAKMNIKLYNEKIFAKLLRKFKALEDALGVLDYYVAIEKQFAGNKKLPEPIKIFITNKVQQQTIALNQLLLNDNWLNGKRIAKINNKLSTVKWYKPSKELKKINTYYTTEIRKITDFVQKNDFEFMDIELGVHELRRKLRWLSIYPHALLGIVTLQPLTPIAPALKKYLTPTVLSSKYNILPGLINNNEYLEISQPHFFALSWLIAELGKIKDVGLTLYALQEAIQSTIKLNKQAAMEYAYTLVTPKTTIAKLLKTANSITKFFFVEDNLTQLLVVK